MILWLMQTDDTRLDLHEQIEPSANDMVIVITSKKFGAELWTDWLLDLPQAGESR